MLPALVLAALACAAPARAQYFSQGWTPGQPVPTAASEFPPDFDPSQLPPAAAPPKPSKPGQSIFSLDTVLTAAPVVDLLSRFGINITERLAAAHEATKLLWDERIPLITDDNFKDLIVEEELTPEEERDRVWLLIVTATAAQATGVSAWADKQFDEAYNLTQIEGDLPNVRWGRIDYLNVTTLTTKWSVWQAPMVVLIKDRGMTLRFWRANKIRLRPEALREFLKSEEWQHTPPWSTSFAPGGSREFLMQWQAVFMTKLYNLMRYLPRWAVYIITGALGSVIINIFHRDEKSKQEKEAKAKAKKELESAPVAPAPAASGSSTGVAKPQSAAPTAKGKSKKGKK
ncbi:hypothetical protein FA95DRAFT_1530661 [Auriscalpium vulgare]|uniref:Uncharacterized protein n=1 Tax=Auriscalpium vulgare TaxID=40419 RepID=A0ACB8SCQ4_9AGAM|nr:hypothetical protein FA95DRAFT_1530661 [Auriscalpium vulgare]